MEKSQAMESFANDLDHDEINGNQKFADNMKMEKRCSKQTLRNILTFSIIWISYYFINAGFSMLGPFFPQEAAKFGVQKLLIGFIISVAALFVVILSPLFGYFVPEIGLKFMLLSGAFLVGGSYFLFGFLDQTNSYAEFVTLSISLRVVEGVGTAGCYISAFTIAANLYPTKPGTVIGVLEVASSLGFITGPPLGGFLFEFGGFILPFTFTGSLILIFVPILYVFVPQIESKKQFLPPKTVAKLLSDFVFVLLVLCGVDILGSIGFFFPTLAPFLSSQFHLSNLVISFLFLLSPLVYMATSLVVGQLADFIGPRYIIITGYFVCSLFYFLIGPTPFITDESNLWLTCVSYAATGIGLSLAFIPAFSDMLSVARNIDDKTEPEVITAVVSGITSSSISLGYFLGPLAGGALLEVFSFQMAATIIGMVLIAKGFLLLGVTLTDKFLKK